MVINIVMPVYNTPPEWIQEAINSITFQSFEYWALIIIDDASTNLETISYIKSIQNDKIRTYLLSDNIGEMQVRLYAKNYLDNDCKYIAFMDSDDIMLPQRLEKQFLFLENNKDIDIVGAQIQFFCNQDDVSYNIQPKNSFTFHHFNVNDNIFTKSWSINNPTTMIKREIIENFDVSLIDYYKNLCGIPKDRFSDYIFYSILAKNNFQIRNLSDILLLYRCSSHQISQRIKINNTLETHKLLRNKILLDVK